jgi:hypothetical protein
MPSDDALMKASGDVTEALRRTIDSMQGELERSVLTSQMLGISLLVSILTLADSLYTSCRGFYRIPPLNFFHARYFEQSHGYIQTNHNRS